MTKPYFAAIDQGTTSSRCIVFDEAGAPVGSAQTEHRQIFPRPGWVAPGGPDRPPMDRLNLDQKGTLLMSNKKGTLPMRRSAPAADT